MDLRTTHYYALDRGLDSMSLLDETVPASLPEQSTLVPPQLRYPAQLQQLLDKPDLSEFLVSAFVLPTGNAVLSGPSQFAAALENAKEELHALLSDTTAPLAYGMGKAPPTSSGKSKAAARSGSKLKSERKSGAKSGSIVESEDETDAAFGVEPKSRREYGSESDEPDGSEHDSDRDAESTSQSGSAHSRPKLSPRIERLVQRAGRVLERESGLRADLASYRAALLKG